MSPQKKNCAAAAVAGWRHRHLQKLIETITKELAAIADDVLKRELHSLLHTTTGMLDDGVLADSSLAFVGPDAA